MILRMQVSGVSIAVLVRRDTLQRTQRLGRRSDLREAVNGITPAQAANDPLAQILRREQPAPLLVAQGRRSGNQPYLLLNLLFRHLDALRLGDGIEHQVSAYSGFGGGTGFL